MSPSALEWLESYLNGRYQYVRIGDVVSQSLPVDYRIPQGSILGPVLLTVYINDLLTRGGSRGGGCAGVRTPPLR